MSHSPNPILAVLTGVDAEADEAVLRVAEGLGSLAAVCIGQQADSLAAATTETRLHVWDPLLEEELTTGETSLAALYAAVAAAAAQKVGAVTVAVPDDPLLPLGPLLAERLGVVHASGVLHAKPAIEAEQPSIRLTRRTLAGRQHLRGPASAVLCVLREATSPSGSDSTPPHRPEPATPVEHLDLAGLGLAVDELPKPRVRMVVPEVRSAWQPRRFDTVAALAERLRLDGLREDEERA